MEKARYLGQRARTSANLFPALVRNPKATLSWLVGARVAQIVFLAVLVTVPTLFIPTADWILEAIYPPVSKQELFGLVQMTRQDPRLPGRKGLTQDALWTGGGMLVLALFFLQIPASVERARARSRVDEDKADSLALEQPNTSQLLYQSALKMAIGAEDVSRIEEKIRKLNPSAPRGNSRRESHAVESASEETLAVDGGSGEQFGGSIKVGVEMSQVGKGGRYHLTGLLGHGATGSVYRAYDGVLERDVAIKVLLPDLMNNQKAASRFRQEAL
jgi:hypothetical protein